MNSGTQWSGFVQDMGVPCEFAPTHDLMSTCNSEVLLIIHPTVSQLGKKILHIYAEKDIKFYENQENFHRHCCHVLFMKLIHRLISCPKPKYGMYASGLNLEVGSTLRLIEVVHILTV